MERLYLEEGEEEEKEGEEKRREAGTCSKEGRKGRKKEGGEVRRGKKRGGKGERRGKVEGEQSSVGEKRVMMEKEGNELLHGTLTLAVCVVGRGSVGRTAGWNIQS